jgi:hypothetical protein
MARALSRGGVREEAVVPEVAVIGAGVAGTVAGSATEQAAGRAGRGHLRGLLVGPIVLKLDGQERPLTAPVVCDPGDARPADWVLLATTKAHAARGAGVGSEFWLSSSGPEPLRRLRPTLGPSPSLSGYASRVTAEAKRHVSSHPGCIAQW